MTNAANHFGHRESGGLVIDLFWDPGELEDEFRVTVEDRREGARFVLHPATGREAIEAYHHPFSAASVALNGKAAGIRFEEQSEAPPMSGTKPSSMHPPTPTEDANDEPREAR